MTDNLKPVRCGCGGEASCYFTHYWGKCFTVQCSECGIETKPYDTEAEAVTAWNRAMGERTAKAKDLDRRSETSMCWEGICTKCGAYTMHEMNYCFHCGARLEWE